ncbi:polysaccharide deacetylase family protein [Ktedonobacteria bacterium brp13]|nr:polysaccharide deacetylase family protein [Ktedonobacteria bacterium brp13]
MLLVLIIALSTFGVGIVVYANNSHSVEITSSRIATPTVLPTATPTVLPTATPTVLPTPTPAVTKTAIPSPTLQGPVIGQGSSNQPRIALTFDDGPYPYYTSQILDILKQYHVHATFFCIGENVSYYPTLVQREHAEGHVVGNHTWDHADLTQQSVQKIQSEIGDTSIEIKDTIGVTPTLFRPPYGAINATVQSQAEQLHLTPILWNVDTQDWQQPGTNSIVKTVLDNAMNGDIILMHDGGGNRAQTVAALPTIITSLRQQGYQLVTVPELIN